MKNKELSIGDWVCYGQKRKAVVVWLGTDRCRILVGSITGDEIVEETYDNIDPIPLTPEILEYNGFNTCEFYSELIIDERRIMCDCHNISILHGDHVDLDTPIEYVHELQHALKLCRIEKEIEL